MRFYSDAFYDNVREGARRSARGIVPLIVDLVEPRSVVDVGCGEGTWLSVFIEHGVEDVLGLDGEHIDTDELEIPAGRFRALDLTKPFQLHRTFDLVVSLEVGEHLPLESAEGFVESLTKLGPVVLFSAAIPFQGGTRHVNEQWQSWWADLFRDRGYVVIDCVREPIWERADVEAWYAQNMMVLAETGHIESAATGLARAYEKGCRGPLSIVHPRLYLETAHQHRAAAKAVEGYALAVEAYREDAERHGAADANDLSLRALVAAAPSAARRSAQRLWRETAKRGR